MKHAVTLAFALAAALPMAGHAQSAPPPKPGLADVQKVVQGITADAAKLQTYCQLGKLSDQIGKAYEAKDNNAVQTLSAQADALGQKLGPDYIRLTENLGEVDENSAFGKQIAAVFDEADKKCK